MPLNCGKKDRMMAITEADIESDGRHIIIIIASMKYTSI